VKHIHLCTYKRKNQKGYYLGDQIKENEMGGTWNMHDMRNAYSILVGQSEGDISLRRYRHRWEVNIRWILGKQSGRVWTGLICLRIETNGGLF
jgi:hypothetical protein